MHRAECSDKLSAPQNLETSEQQLISDAIDHCVLRIRGGWSDESAGANEARLKGLIEKLAQGPGGGPFSNALLPLTAVLGPANEA